MSSESYTVLYTVSFAFPITNDFPYYLLLQAEMEQELDPCFSPPCFNWRELLFSFGL